jgi:hypothetical protein
LLDKLGSCGAPLRTLDELAAEVAMAHAV